MPETVFRTQGVSKVYTSGPVKVFALADVSLEMFAGEFTVLPGPSGSGKSTLLNILGGLDHVTGGRVWFRDMELTTLNDRALTRYRRDHVGFVFQFYNLVASLTARENVQLVTNVPISPMEPAEALDLVGLGQAHESLSCRTVRGRAAARGHCAGDRQAPGYSAL